MFLPTNWRCNSSLNCTRAGTSEFRRLVSLAQKALWDSGIPREAISAIQQPWGRTSATFQDERLPMDILALQGRDPHPLQKHAYFRQLDATMAHDTLDRLPRIMARTLVLVGGEDILTPPHESVELAKHIPNSELRILPRGGHGFSGEYPHDFNRAVLEFLRA